MTPSDRKSMPRPVAKAMTMVMDVLTCSGMQTTIAGRSVITE